MSAAGQQATSDELIAKAQQKIIEVHEKEET